MSFFWNKKCFTFRVGDTRVCELKKCRLKQFIEVRKIVTMLKLRDSAKRKRKKESQNSKYTSVNTKRRICKNSVKIRG